MDRWMIRWMGIHCKYTIILYFINTYKYYMSVRTKRKIFLKEPEKKTTQNRVLNSQTPHGLAFWLFPRAQFLRQV
jgi:hypothetical protein